MEFQKETIYRYQPLWGSWQVDGLVGKGSFGSVYRVSREEMGYRYYSAVKLITVPSDDQYREAVATIDNDEETLMGYFGDIVKNIVKEINLLYNLRGTSNIISYEDHMVVKKENELGWDILIRMELASSLTKHTSANLLTRRQIAQLGIDICSALAICGKEGIIHRDIKDENIFISDKGVFKLGDFGIARELSRSGRAASIRGTPLYMAPEVFKGDRYDASVDLYSLGLVMYKLLNQGRLPFMPPYPQEIKYNDSEAAIDRRISGEAMPLPSKSGDELGKIVIKACSHDQKDRYASPAEMKKALEGLLNEFSAEFLDEEVTVTKTKGANTRTASIDRLSAGGSLDGTAAPAGAGSQSGMAATGEVRGSTGGSQAINAGNETLKGIGQASTGGSQAFTGGSQSTAGGNQAFTGEGQPFGTAPNEGTVLIRKPGQGRTGSGAGGAGGAGAGAAAGGTGPAAGSGTGTNAGGAGAAAGVAGGPEAGNDGSSKRRIPVLVLGIVGIVILAAALFLIFRHPSNDSTANASGTEATAVSASVASVPADTAAATTAIAATAPATTAVKTSAVVTTVPATTAAPTKKAAMTTAAPKKTADTKKPGTSTKSGSTKPTTKPAPSKTTPTTTPAPTAKPTQPVPSFSMDYTADDNGRYKFTISPKDSRYQYGFEYMAGGNWIPSGNIYSASNTRIFPVSGAFEPDVYSIRAFVKSATTGKQVWSTEIKINVK